MMLFLCAQDLSFFWLGIVTNNSFSQLEKFSAAPEMYLKTLDQFLQNRKITLKDIKGICVVTGPGSFTSSRISLTIANAIHFVLQTPLFAMQNTENFSPRELLEKKGIGICLSESSYAHATYNRPANITIPHGDKTLE